MHQPIPSVTAVAHLVKRWQGTRMVLRWTAAEVLEAEQCFRKVVGYRVMPKPLVALRAHGAAIDPTTGRTDVAKAAA